MIAAPSIRPSSALRLPFSPRARLQIGLFALAYVVYTAARFVTIGDLGDAKAHAAWIVSFEHTFHLGVEASVQNALNGSWVIWILNRLYLLAQMFVIPAVLIFLYNRSFAIYATLRNTILATWLLSVPVYGLFPVAPPRLADIGITDTITSQTGISMTSNFSTSFYNELAAVPSLHVGFAVAVGFALFAAIRQPVLRWVALLWGPIVALAVVATGNHFVVDAVAGLVASAAGYLLGAAAARIRLRRPSLTRTLCEA
jgi:membrane-associated phospholipid phosphatase